jgi:hypothetical protein
MNELIDRAPILVKYSLLSAIQGLVVVVCGVGAGWSWTEDGGGVKGRIPRKEIFVRPFPEKRPSVLNIT